ncbi:MAG: helix-turn-helix transcriptional regulator [Chromatiales bacterium]|jgi:AraC-like DNA-binding protein
MPTSKRSPEAPLVKLHLAMPFLTELESRGLDCEETLNQFDLTRTQLNDESVLVAARTMYQLLDALAELAEDPTLALSIGEKLDLSTWPLMREAVQNAVTIGDFFIRFIARARGLASKIEYELEIKGSTAKFRLIRAGDPGFCPQQTDSLYVGLFWNIFTCLMGDDWKHEELRMQVCKPEIIPDFYRGLRIYKCDNTGFRMHFPSEWLSKTIVLKSKLTTCNSSPSYDIPPEEFIEAISKILLQHIHLNDLNTARAAELCGYSQRRLSRLLKEKGTSINRLLAQLRQQQAARLLLETDQPVTEIALAIGFKELSGFTRSFKRWTGQSPREYRLNQRADHQ